MSVIERRHAGNRILLTVAILPPEPATLHWIEAPALIDTGATTSGISTGIATELGLRTVGKRPLASAHGEDLVDRFLFRVGLFADRADEDERPALPFLFDEVEGFRLRDGFQFRVIIGMDILLQCDLTIDSGAVSGCNSAFPDKFATVRVHG